MRSKSTLGMALGALAFVVGLIGYQFLGWRFSDGPDNPLTFVLAILAVAAAVGVTLRDRL